RWTRRRPDPLGRKVPVPARSAQDCSRRIRRGSPCNRTPQAMRKQLPPALLTATRKATERPPEASPERNRGTTPTEPQTATRGALHRALRDRHYNGGREGKPPTRWGQSD